MVRPLSLRSQKGTRVPLTDVIFAVGGLVTLGGLLPMCAKRTRVPLSTSGPTAVVLLVFSLTFAVGLHLWLSAATVALSALCWSYLFGVCTMLKIPRKGESVTEPSEIPVATHREAPGGKIYLVRNDWMLVGHEADQLIRGLLGWTGGAEEAVSGERAVAGSQTPEQATGSESPPRPRLYLNPREFTNYDRNPHTWRNGTAQEIFDRSAKQRTRGTCPERGAGSSCD